MFNDNHIIIYYMEGIANYSIQIHDPPSSITVKALTVAIWIPLNGQEHVKNSIATRKDTTTLLKYLLIPTPTCTLFHH